MQHKKDMEDKYSVALAIVHIFLLIAFWLAVLAKGSSLVTVDIWTRAFVKILCSSVIVSQ